MARSGNPHRHLTPRRRPEPGVGIRGAGGPLHGLLRPGDRILELDGQPLEDVLDFHYYSALSELLRLKVRDEAGALRELRVRAEDLEAAHLDFEPLVFKSCGNDCVFCFIHQMPPGLREDLYFMDEDYRLGFMYGNYVTLALARERELQRIVRQQLSPIYLSVHATDMELRNRLLGLKRSRDILEIIRRLIDGGIGIHTQVVLLPGWNDGAQLDRTMADLAAFYPDVASLGIVPVGLTDHRRTLTTLTGFDAAGAARALDQVEAFQDAFRREHGGRFVFPADEFYLLAGRPLPPQADYEDFPLIDNGIGMARDFVDAVLAEARRWRAPSRPRRAGLLTGRLGDELFRRHLDPALAKLPGLELRRRALDNRLFGAHITVSGLLPGRELLAAAGELADGIDLLLLPPNTVNAAGLFLDDLSLDEFRAALPVPVAMPESGLLGPLGA